jgi:hypothetical protein
MKIICGFLLCLCAVVSIFSQTVKTTADLKQQIKTLEERERYRIEYYKSQTKIYVAMAHLIPGKIRGDGDVFFTGNFRFDGKELKEDVQTFELKFTSGSYDGQRFLTNRLLIVLVDGVRMDFGEGNREAYVVSTGGSQMSASRRSPDEFDSLSSSYNREELSFKASREQIEQIGSGKQVEFLLGDFPAVMTDESKQMLKNLLLLSHK